MSTPFLAELKIVSFNFAPKGWALCNGQLLPINQNQALFSLLGTTYGGNGQTTFALPNLQGRLPVHVGNGITLGQSAGEPAHTLILSEMPAHTHPATGSTGGPTAGNPTNSLWATFPSSKPYGTALDTSMNPQDITSTGGSQQHDNMPPYLVLNVIIALQGIFPSRN